MFGIHGRTPLLRSYDSVLAFVSSAQTSFAPAFSHGGSDQLAGSLWHRKGLDLSGQISDRDREHFRDEREPFPAQANVPEVLMKPPLVGAFTLNDADVGEYFVTAGLEVPKAFALLTRSTPADLDIVGIARPDHVDGHQATRLLGPRGG